VTTEYYCEIPWSQIWAEFNSWFNEENAIGMPDWDKQEQRLQQIITERIVHLFTSFSWHHRVWKRFDKWCEPEGCASYYKTLWPEQQREIKRLVQEEADYQINRIQ